MGDGYQEVQEVISIHAPTRGATIIFQMSLSRTLFQSTLPREERQLFFLSTVQCLYFNPRSHERSDAKPTDAQAAAMEFQSTLPREERRLAM